MLEAVVSQMEALDGIVAVLEVKLIKAAGMVVLTNGWKRVVQSTLGLEGRLL